MIRFINFLRKEYLFSFIRVKSDKPFGCQFIYYTAVRSELRKVDDIIGFSTTI